MDNSSTITLIVINLILNFLQVLDHLISRLKSSKCWGASLQFNDSKTETKEFDINEFRKQYKGDKELIKQLEALTDKKDSVKVIILVK